MKALTDFRAASNGVNIPCMGFGTWQSVGEVCENAVRSALDAGYRLIDTAAAYGNEESVGKAIAKSRLDRKDVFVTSKLRNSAHGYESTLAAFEGTVKKLGVDYLDLYLIHWPNPLPFRSDWKRYTRETWRAFETLYDAGRIRCIGVSNFLPHHLEALMEESDGYAPRYLPMVNQLKLCPGITQSETVEYCKKRGILLEAYSPFGTGSVFKAPEMLVLAEKYGKTPGQLCLAWSMKMGFIPLPKSANPERIKENTDVFDIELSEEDTAAIAAMNICGEAPDPDTIGF